MKKQSILLLAAALQASFVTSNGKKAFGYTDGQVILRNRANLHGQGVYVRIEGTAGAEKLYAFQYNVSGEHEFVERSRLISVNGYDARWAALFEESVTGSGITTSTVTYGGINYQIASGLGVNERPNFEAFVGFEKAYYPTSSGVIYVQPSQTVSGTLSPLSRTGELPRDANGAVKIYTEAATTTLADATAASATSVKGWWATRKTWEKALIVAGILGLVVLALRKIKI